MRKFCRHHCATAAPRTHSTRRATLIMLARSKGSRAYLDADHRSRSPLAHKSMIFISEAGEGSTGWRDCLRAEDVRVERAVRPASPYNRPLEQRVAEQEGVCTAGRTPRVPPSCWKSARGGRWVSSQLCRPSPSCYASNNICSSSEAVNARDTAIDDMQRQNVEDETEHEVRVATHEKAVTTRQGRRRQARPAQRRSKTYEMRTAERLAHISGETMYVLPSLSSFMLVVLTLCYYRGVVHSSLQTLARVMIRTLHIPVV